MNNALADKHSTLERRSRRGNWFVRLFFNPGGFLLAYAIFDTIATWLRVHAQVSEALDERIIISPMPKLEDSFILLAAAIAFKIGTRLGRIASFCCACWILYRGVEALSDVATVKDIPVLVIRCVQELVGNRTWALGSTKGVDCHLHCDCCAGDHCAPLF